MKCFTSFWSLWGLRNEMTPLIKLSVCLDANGSVNGNTWQKGHVAHDINCLDLKNAVVQFASCDANAGTSSVTWPSKYDVVPQFDWLGFRNVVVSLMILLLSYDADTGTSSIGVACPKISHCISFWSSWSKECNVAINDTAGITWQQYKCHVMPKSMPMRSQ